MSLNCEARRQFSFWWPFCIVFFFESSLSTLWPTLFSVQIWIIMCIWRDSESCDCLKCLLSFIYILWISNFDIIFGYTKKKLALALDYLRGGCVYKIIFSLFCLYTFFWLVFNYKMEQRMTVTLGLYRDPFTWRTTPIMSDFSSSEYSYISLT